MSQASKVASEIQDYTASSIEVLEGLEPVRRRPGMYIGGTDEAALHHLAAEIIDNAMDEAVAGHASFLEVSLAEGNRLTVRDNGRGIPIDPHPKFPKKSALEVILTTLHSGGKFSGKAYATSGGLHGVGSSVVNALSSVMEVEVAREKTIWRQSFAKGVPTSKLTKVGPTPNRRGTTISFIPDEEIFGARKLSPAKLFKLCRSKAYLFKGVKIRWSCPTGLLPSDGSVPESGELHFPDGLLDSLKEEIEGADTLVSPIWHGNAEAPETGSKIEWAVAWQERGDGSLDSYCNTIPTPQGGTHEAGFRSALLKAIRAFGEQRGNKRASVITAEDVAGSMVAKLSIFIREPQFQGQTKDKLTSADAAKITEVTVRDRFEHHLVGDPAMADNLLAYFVERAEERIRRKEAKLTPRKSVTKRLRLPGKLTDCTREIREDTEIFLVEGDSAGGSAKQARSRETQAVLPLRGKILNVASASSEKMRQNQEIKDLIEAIGAGSGDRFNLNEMRYGRVIIMTDADVDGAHIATLLITFFYQEMPLLVREGRLFLARPPLYRLVQGGKSIYAMDDADRDRLLKKHFKPNAKVEISRFKGLGEMPPAVLKETTMDPAKRTLVRVTAPAEDRATNNAIVDQLMGKRPETRFRFIQDNARHAVELDI